MSVIILVKSIYRMVPFVVSILLQVYMDLWRCYIINIICMFVITIREKLENFAFMPSVLLVLLLLLRVVVVLRAAAAVPPSITTTTTNLRKNLVHRRNLGIIITTIITNLPDITTTTIPNLQDHQALMYLL